MTGGSGYVLWTDGVFVSSPDFPIRVVVGPHISIERVRQPLTAILGHLDLALQAAEEAMPLRQARAAALRLRDMCAEAALAPKEIEP